MAVKRAAVAATIAFAALTFGVAPVSAAPLDPAPPCADCQPDPGGPQAVPTPARQPCWPYGRVGPGGPRGGGGVPIFPPPCHPTAPVGAVEPPPSVTAE
jgi:hypothetical protein